MKTNWTYKTIKFLKKIYFKNDKRVAAYLVCVVIATCFWFLNALSKTYTVDMTVPVAYINFPNNKTLSGKPDNQFNLKIKAHGFAILRHKIIFFFSPLEFNVNEMTKNRMTESKRSYFAFPAKEFTSELAYQMANELEILSMTPDTLIFKFDKMGQKLVKVTPMIKINLKKQFQISGDIKTTPDSVIVNGPQSTIDTLRFVSTETKRFNAVGQPVQTQARIKPIKDLYFEPEAVDISIPVEEYTESQQSVPVSLINQPANVKIKLFPPKVKVSFQVGLSRFAEMNPEDFKLTVNYSDIKERRQRLRITAESVPPYLYALKITPEEVEYLIEN